MIKRNISDVVLEALGDNPVVLLHGARQTGKTTLVRWMAKGPHRARYMTMDDAGVLAAARNDPAGFISGIRGPVILDEVQRAPDLFLAIKAEVDRDRSPGRFLLTGSADVFLLPRLSESLAGRMEIITLWPFSQGEIESVKEGFIDALFSGSPPERKQRCVDRGDLFSKLLVGGYPEVLQRPSSKRRSAWFGSYITTILQRDVRDLANIEGLTDLPRLLSLLAARAASLVNFSEISRSVGMPQSTLKRYMALLETTFLVQLLPAWSGNLGKRLVKSPKLVLSDSGLMGYLLGLEDAREAPDSAALGPLLENFVVMELRKQASWSRVRPVLFHFRAQTGREVDVVLEGSGGRVVALEVKASATVGAGDFKGLRALASALGKKFVYGAVLYTGRESIPFGRKLHALPVSLMWRHQA